MMQSECMVRTASTAVDGFHCAARQLAHGQRRAAVKAVLVGALLAMLTPRGSGQLIVGGMFNTVAGNNTQYFKKIAQWRGTLERAPNSDSEPPSQWLSMVQGASSEFQFGVTDRVFALAFEPSLQWLIIGGDFSQEPGALLLAGELGELPGPSRLRAWHYFYKKGAQGNLLAGPVHALEYVAKPLEDGRNSEKSVP
jgi:hypothetical protein